MANVAYFRDFLAVRGRSLGVTTCVMQSNWRQFPALLEFCMARNMEMRCLNEVEIPLDHALHTLPAPALSAVIDYLEKAAPQWPDTPAGYQSEENHRRLIHNLRGFLDQQGPWWERVPTSS